MCELMEYSLPVFSYNLNDIFKNKGKLRLETKARVSVGFSSLDDNIGIVRIIICTQNVKDDPTIVYEMHIMGKFNLKTENKITDDEKSKILKEKGVPKLYSILEATFAKVQEVTKTKLPSMPTYKEIIDSRE